MRPSERGPAQHLPESLWPGRQQTGQRTDQSRRSSLGRAASSAWRRQSGARGERSAKSKWAAAEKEEKGILRQSLRRVQRRQEQPAEYEPAAPVIDSGKRGAREAHQRKNVAGRAPAASNF